MAEAMVVDVVNCGTGCSTSWQPHLPVSATEGANGLPRFTCKMAVKTLCACVYYKAVIVMFCVEKSAELYIC